MQLFAVISLTTALTACGDKPKEQEQTQAPQEEQTVSEQDIAGHDAEKQTEQDESATVIDLPAVEITEAEPNSEETEVDGGELSELEKEAMSMADDVNE